MNRYTYIWIYVDMNLKKRPVADEGEDTLGSPFQ